MARGLSAPGPLIIRPSWEMGCPEIVSSMGGTGRARIIGMRSGVMVVGKVRFESAFPSSGS